MKEKSFGFRYTFIPHVWKQIKFDFSLQIIIHIVRVADEKIQLRRTDICSFKFVHTWGTLWQPSITYIDNENRIVRNKSITRKMKNNKKKYQHLPAIFFLLVRLLWNWNTYWLPIYTRESSGKFLVTVHLTVLGNTKPNNGANFCDGFAIIKKKRVVTTEAN